jgi:hypothetical protein
MRVDKAPKNGKKLNSKQQLADSSQNPQLQHLSTLNLLIIAEF